MLVRYSKFLKIFDNRISSYFNLHKEHLCCTEGCYSCCEVGEYPFSRLEAEYIMSGYVKLSNEIQHIIRSNIKHLIEIKTKKNNMPPFLYKCPFLIAGKCSLYDYRGIVCRVHGLAYIKNYHVVLPECSNFGKNYSKLYNSKTKILNLSNPISEDLNTEKILRGELAQSFQLECGEIRPLINWFINIS